ncbi:hypothetical protein RGF97_20945 [Streptomyces roseicoloratus]|uniref:AG1 protein n=1 Tax=Streptomyces roseicoloratus TaxID=2508722 RepID=A0ABY9RX79_9ACTN|nr:hypothetical protein [Streptomyces roseicoloratus]WMX46797.1 hypothetical protein RGF97_20945 [Streptomyces roseicoloratus]
MADSGGVVSFEEEWAVERAAAATRVGMRVNGLPAGQAGSGSGGGSGGADLAVRQDHLGAVGHAAYELNGRLAKDGNHARTDTSDAATGLSRNAFRTGSALTTVQETWASQLRTLLDACAHISNHLDHSAAAHARDDEEIKAALAVSKINEYFT